MARLIDLDAVRIDLTARIAAIDDHAARVRAPELAGAIDAIRVIAHGAGLNPTVTVIHFIAAALARGECGAAAVRDWLHMLRDAVSTDRQDVAACNAFAAACSVRLAA